MTLSLTSRKIPSRDNMVRPVRRRSWGVKGATPRVANRFRDLATLRVISLGLASRSGYFVLGNRNR
jgi:hypothetical protein